MDGIEPSTVAEMLLGAVAVAVLVVLVVVGVPRPGRGRSRRRDWPTVPVPDEHSEAHAWEIDATPGTPDGRHVRLAQAAQVELTLYWGRGDAPTVHLGSDRGEWHTPDVEVPGRGEPFRVGIGAGRTALVVRPAKAQRIRVELRVHRNAGFELLPGSSLGDR